MSSAWVLVLDPPNDGGDPGRRIGGLSLVERLVLDAQAAGASGVVCSRDVAPLLADPRVRIPVLDAVPGGTRAIRVRSSQLVHRGLFKAIVARDETSVTPPLTRDLARERFPFAEAWGFEPIDVTSDALALEAEGLLFRSLRKKQDGWTSRYLNRYISLALTRLLVKTKLLPNQVSVVILGIGLLGAWFASRGDYASVVIGAFLFQSQSVLDGCDGEMSRVTHRGSRTGEWLDTVGDDLTNYGFFGGLGIGLYRTTGLDLYLAAGIVTVVCGVIVEHARVPLPDQDWLGRPAQVPAQPGAGHGTPGADPAALQARHLRVPDFDCSNIGPGGPDAVHLRARRDRDPDQRDRDGDSPGARAGERGRRVRVRLGLALGLGTLFAVTRAEAQLPAEGEPIRTNRYSIDLYQGPVLASTRVTGLAGAFVAMAEGVDGNTQNPASPAVRTLYSREHFDYDLGVGITFPSTISNTDFFNSGKRTDIGQPEQSGFVFLGIAVNLTFGRWGFGLTTDLQNYNLNRAEDATGAQGDQLNGQIAVGHLLLAHSFVDGQLAIGIGARTLALDVNSQTARGERTLFSTVGAGFETGFVWKPNDHQFRVGAAFRTAVNTEASPESQQRIVYRDDPTNELWLPDEVALPWDLNVGAAIQLGPRPLNPRFVDPNELTLKLRRYLAWRARARASKTLRALARSSRGTRHGRPARCARRGASAEQALDDARRTREHRADRLAVLRYASMERFFVPTDGVAPRERRGRGGGRGRVFPGAPSAALWAGRQRLAARHRGDRAHSSLDVVRGGSYTSRPASA